MIVQLVEPKFKTTQYYKAIATGNVVVEPEADIIIVTNLKCPNCGIHIGDKVMGADYYQPFICPKCKGVFAFDLRCFRTANWYGRLKRIMERTERI